MERGGRKEKEGGRQVGEKWGRQKIKEKRWRREKGEEEWEKTTPCPPLHRFRDSFCLFVITNAHHTPVIWKLTKYSPPFFHVANKANTKTPFAKNDPSQDLFKSKYVFVKTNDYIIFLRINSKTDKVLYPSPVFTLNFSGHRPAGPAL